MPSFSERLRFATVVAVAAILVIAGAVAGAAGQALILGQANSAGFSNTSVTTNTNSGTAFQVTQQGTGTALRGIAGIGIAGFFTSANGAGVSGVVANKNGFGVYAANDATSAGTGAALRANGESNVAIKASSTSQPPISINGPTSQPPMTVNSSGKVTNLNADMTDGWSFGCPSGTVYTEGLCFETTNRAAQNVYDAADTCASAGNLLGQIWRYRLPTIHELRSARGVSGITIDAAGELTDSLFEVWNGSANQTDSWLVFDNGTISAVVGGTTAKFRCVTPPYSFYFSLVPLTPTAAPSYGATPVDKTGLVGK